VTALGEDVLDMAQTVYGVRNGLNLDELDVTTDEEIDQQLTRARKSAASWILARCTR
jgi:hypothetical protein